MDIEFDELSSVEQAKIYALTRMYSELADGQSSHIILGACMNLVLGLLEQAPNQACRNEIAGTFRDMAVELEKPIVEDEVAEVENGHADQ